MALPKYKTSRANTHSRRANWKATAGIILYVILKDLPLESKRLVLMYYA